MHSENSKVYIGSETSTVVDGLLTSLLNDYQFSLRTKMKKSKLTYDRVKAFYYKLHKISINKGGGSYIDSPDWIKNQNIKSWLKTKKVHKAIVFYQEAWLKLCIVMNTKLRKNAKNNSEKEFYKLMNNAVFGRSIMNVRKHRDIKLVTDDKKRCKLASMTNYHTTKQFSENFLAMEMKKTKIKMNLPIYIVFTILEVSKTVMRKFF